MSAHRTPWLSGDELARLERQRLLSEDDVLRQLEDYELSQRAAAARAYAEYEEGKRRRNNVITGIVFAVFVVIVVAAILWL